MNAQSKIEAASLHAAMAIAFAEIEGVTKSAVGQVGQQKYKYADLGSVIDALKPALIKHGLFFTQHPEPSDKGVTVETWLHHAGGESLSLGKLFVPANKQDAQGYGSALTYARRYALVTAFGVPVEDDDGNAAARAVRDNANSAVSPDGPAMPPEAYAKIVQLVEATKTNVPTMFQALGIRAGKLDDLSPADYDKAVNALETKLAKLAKAETDAKAKEDA